MPHCHSIFGAAFYIGCCPNCGVGAAIADPVHMLSPPMVPVIFRCRIFRLPNFLLPIFSVAVFFRGPWPFPFSLFQTIILCCLFSYHLNFRCRIFPLPIFPRCRFCRESFRKFWFGSIKLHQLVRSVVAIECHLFSRTHGRNSVLRLLILCKSFPP